MKKNIILAVALGVLIPLHAQKEDDVYNESVLVKGSYRPTIELGEKISFPAMITDTMTRMEHTFGYDITPVRMKSLYRPSRIKAARIIGEPATKLYNNYIRLGMGNYWTPMADLYWSSLRDKKKTYGVRMNHLSSWGKLPDYGKNHYGVTGITLFGKYIVKDLLQLSSDLSYEHDHNLYYGFSDDTLAARMPGKSRSDINTSDIRAKYNIVTWNIGLRNMELDANKLGYGANLRLSDIWGSWGQNEFNLNLSGDIRYGFDIQHKYKGVAYLRAEWDGYSHRYRPEGEMPLGYIPTPITDTLRGSRNIVKFNPYADFMFNGLQFHAGFTMGWDGFSDGNDVTPRFFPDVVVSKSVLNDAMVLSVGLTGGFDANNWNVIRRINPYITPNAEQRATRHYDFAGHMRWTISKKIEANAEISFSRLNDDLTFILDTNYALDNVFNTRYFGDDRLTIGGDIAFVNDEMLTLRAGGHLYSHTLTGGETILSYRPKWDVLVAADVNYNDKWLFHLETQLLGKMDDDQGESLPMRYGINAQVEYRHNKALSFFLKMDNLAFQRYYYWRNYPSQRGLFILGLTYTMPHK
jgi:hypothetical protein